MAVSGADSGARPVSLPRGGQRAAGAGFRISREAALSLGCIVLFLFSAVFALVLTLQSQEAQDRVKDLLMTRAAAASLVSAVRDAEASHRNFLLSGDKEYTQPYRAALITLADRQRQLRDLADPYPAHRDRLDELESLIGEKIGELERTLVLFSRGEREAAIEAVGMNEAQQTLSAIRTLVNRMGVDENRLLASQERREHRLRLLLVGALVASIAAGLGLAWASVREERRTAAMLAGMNKVLEDQVAERTALLESERRRVEGLLSDMTHRVGNSLSLISSMLALQARASADPELRQALMVAHDRVVAVGSAQRRLRYAADYEAVKAREYLQSLVADMRLALAQDRVSLTLAAEEAELSGHDALALGIVVNELVTNALKHAFGHAGGAIAIVFRAEAQQLVLEVSDDGAGLAADNNVPGLGSFVLHSMVKSLNGQLAHEALYPGAERPGTVVRLTFPCRAPAAARRYA